MNLRHISLCALLALAPALHAQFGGLGDLVPGGSKADKVLKNAQDGAKIVKGMAGIGIEEERVIGGSVAVEVVAKYGGLVRDQATLRRVNLVGRTLSQYSHRTTLAWRFGVLDSATVNAFSAPSGYVFITRGLYEMIGDDDDLLAAVLAHEIGHITERHALNIIARNEAFSGAMGIAARNSSEVGNVQAQLQQFDLGIDKIVQTLFDKGFDPQTEYGADAKGRALATTCGYRSSGLREILEKLQSRQGGNAQVFSSHPPLAERIKRLR